jgi:hypothetical protein
MTFVGQGPSRASWERGIEEGRRRGGAETPANHARRRCARLAITGSVGEFLAALLGVHRLALYRDSTRLNLNASWCGKAGKGDLFDEAEGRLTAADVLAAGPAGEKIVLLGKGVARCFGLRGEFLSVHRVAGKQLLVFPHPSKVNRWWNDAANRRRAARALRDFAGARPG